MQPGSVALEKFMKEAKEAIEAVQCKAVELQGTMLAVSQARVRADESQLVKEVAATALLQSQLRRQLSFALAGLEAGRLLINRALLAKPSLMDDILSRFTHWKIRMAARGLLPEHIPCNISNGQTSFVAEAGQRCGMIVQSTGESSGGAGEKDLSSTERHEAKDRAALDGLHQPGAVPSGSRAQPEKLRGVLTDLRQKQQGLKFHSRMAAEVAAAVTSAKYSQDNFAYGTTPYYSWRMLFRTPMLDEAMARAVQQRKEYVVWGSSLGWLVFYGCLTYGVKGRGVELLQGHVEGAREVAKTWGVEGVEFACGDVLESDVGQAAVVLLASMCWDESLKERAAAKLARDLPPGALVVDYLPTLAALNEFGEPLHVAFLPVSWNAKQPFYIFQKKSLGM